MWSQPIRSFEFFVQHALEELTSETFMAWMVENRSGTLHLGFNAISGGYNYRSTSESIYEDDYNTNYDGRFW